MTNDLENNDDQSIVIISFIITILGGALIVGSLMLASGKHWIIALVLKLFSAGMFTAVTAALVAVGKNQKSEKGQAGVGIGFAVGCVIIAIFLFSL